MLYRLKIVLCKIQPVGFDDSSALRLFIRRNRSRRSYGILKKRHKINQNLNL